ncbi:hypothetical protein B0H13DRAFT_2274857, partial [Mycena leptocephala]
MWNQISVPASIGNVGTITLYLILMAGLKITTAALFQLVPVDALTSFGSNSTSSSPFLLAPLRVKPLVRRLLADHDIKWSFSEGEEDPTYAEVLSSAIAMATMFIYQLKAPSNIGFGLGLQQNMLSDVVASNIGPGTATVNTYTLNVTCATLGGDTVAVIDPDLADNLTTYAVCDGEKRWVRSVSHSPHRNGYLIYTIFTAEFLNTAPNVLRFTPPELGMVNMLQAGCNISDFYDYKCEAAAPTLISIASFNITDTVGNGASQVMLDPPMNPVLSTGAKYASSGPTVSLSEDTLSTFNMSSVSFVQCSLSIVNGSANVDTSSRVILGPGPQRKLVSWQSYEGVEMDSDDNSTFLWAYAVSSSAPTPELSSSSFCRASGLFNIAF